MHEKCKKGWVIDLFGDQITEIFDLLFWDDKDAVIILEHKEIIKMNPMARDLFLLSDIDGFIQKMDKRSKEIWEKFLHETNICILATCQITISDSNECNKVYNLEGCFNYTTFQHIIRFKKIQDSQSHNFNEELKYATIFEYASQGIILTSTSGTILEANQMIETFFDIPTSELMGGNAKLVFSLLPDYHNELSQFFKDVQSNGTAKIVTSKVKADGEVKFYEFNSFFNSSVDMYVTLIRDETEKAQLKKQVKHSKSLSTLGQLAASIAHEIRNPLTSLKGFTQLLSHQVTNEGSQYLEIINSELIRMESILNEFLVLSKPSEQSFQFFSLSSLISQVVDFMYPQGNMQNIELDFVSWNHESDSIFGDPYELKKVFINIIKNAIEVMPNGGKVEVTQSRTDDKQVCVSINDQGSGLTSEQMNKIFLPFYSTKEDGTGLGLAHAYQTIENHRGSIEVESEVNQGTTFYIHLPIYHLDAKNEKTYHDQPNKKLEWDVITSN